MAVEEGAHSLDLVCGRAGDAVFAIGLHEAGNALIGEAAGLEGLHGHDGADGVLIGEALDGEELEAGGDRGKGWSFMDSRMTSPKAAVMQAVSSSERAPIRSPTVEFSSMSVIDIMEESVSGSGSGSGSGVGVGSGTGVGVGTGVAVGTGVEVGSGVGVGSSPPQAAKASAPATRATRSAGQSHEARFFLSFTRTFYISSGCR